MKKNFFYLVAGAIAGVAITLFAAARLPIPNTSEDEYDDFFSLDGCK